MVTSEAVRRRRTDNNVREGANKNGQSRDTGSITHKTQNEDKQSKKTTKQIVNMDATKLISDRGKNMSTLKGKRSIVI